MRLDALALPGLAPQREIVVDALVALSHRPEDAARALGLGPTQLGEIAVNAALRRGPTMAAADRYTGVLYEALDAASLDVPARRWLGRHVLIHSAPFGPVGALDRISAYRLGAATSVPGLPSLRRIWADAVSDALAHSGPGFVVDLRSEAYVALGPVPRTVPSAFVRVVAAGSDGRTRALNHFNKHAKGELVRAMAQSRPRITSSRSFEDWADSAGFALRRGDAGELLLFV